MPEILFPGDNYSTPPGEAAFFASRFPTLSFLWRVLNIIRHDGALAAAGRYGGPEWTGGSLNTLKALERCGIVVSVSGMDNIDRADGPCVFIGNHMSTLETFVLPAFIQPRRDVTFVVKDSLLRYPWFGEVLKARDPVVVERKNPRADLAAVLDGGEMRLRRGTSIIVFPQSTRSLSLDPASFNSIGVKLAKRAGAPVVPLALKTDAWGMGALFKDFGRISPLLPVRFAFGEPFMVTGNGKAEHAAVCGFIGEHLRDWASPGTCVA